MDIIDRYRGCLFGLAVGDALGANYEFLERDTFEATGMDFGNYHEVQLGFFTDDTSMALCLADSLVQSEGINPHDQAYRYIKWLSHGYMSPTGYAFGIGNSTLKALNRFIDTQDPFAGDTDPMTAGNGSLMRLAPIPMAYRKHPADAIRNAGESSRITHQAPNAIHACQFYSYLITLALNGKSKEEILADHSSMFPEITQEIIDVAKGSYKDLQRAQVQSTGYVVHTLEAALWTFHNTESFGDGALLAVNLGDDTDTTAAVYGQLAGAYYGYDNIPSEWTDIIAMKDVLEEMSIQLYELSQVIGIL